MPKEMATGETVGARITRHTQEILALLNARRVMVNAGLRSQRREELPTVSQPLDIERAVNEYAKKLNAEFDRLEQEGRDAKQQLQHLD